MDVDHVYSTGIQGWSWFKHFSSTFLCFGIDLVLMHLSTAYTALEKMASIGHQLVNAKWSTSYLFQSNPSVVYWYQIWTDSILHQF